MKRHVMLAAVIVCVAGSGIALADGITLTLDNESAQSIVGLYATPKGGGAASYVNLLTGGEVAASGTGEITLAALDSQCVYDLKIAFGDGSSIERPDVDLCQTDALVIN